jgi:hypothetical protein
MFIAVWAALYLLSELILLGMARKFRPRATLVILAALILAFFAKWAAVGLSANQIILPWVDAVAFYLVTGTLIVFNLRPVRLRGGIVFVLSAVFVLVNAATLVVSLLS